MEGNSLESNELLKILAGGCVRLRPSSTHGVGVFAFRKIPQGATPLKRYNREERYTLLTLEQVSTLPIRIQEMINSFGQRIKGGINFPAIDLNSLDVSYFVNHSPNPNLMWCRKTFEFVTLREILDGEELTVDYSTIDEIPTNFE
jgi:SET domain-containing protein